MIAERIAGDLAERFPEGYRAFTEDGRRVAVPRIYACAGGWRTNINGFRMIYSEDGARLLSAGEANCWRNGNRTRVMRALSAES